MSKQLHTFKLIGKLADNSEAKTSDADDVTHFATKGDTIIVNVIKGAVVVRTINSQSSLAKHKTMNIYSGKIGGNKAQLTVKKIVGTLHIWY